MGRMTNGSNGMEVLQAYLNNISFCSDLEDLEYYSEETLVELVVNAAKNGEAVSWSVPQWALPGDAVFFCHTKTAIAKITALETALKKQPDYPKYSDLWNALQRARVLQKKWRQDICRRLCCLSSAG